MIDRGTFFDAVRVNPFPGSLNQGQVDGMAYILDAWEMYRGGDDLRWLANFMAQAFHESASTMLPVEEYGQGEGQPYGEIDPETKQGYWGRGLIQCTWRENYARADSVLGFTGEDRCEWNADLQLDPAVSARTGYRGMVEGWFRSDSKGPQTLGRYFNETTDDPYGAREIINGDKTYRPDWGHGQTICQLIAGYHAGFLTALQAASRPSRGDA